MPRYYFNLRQEGRLIEDQDGTNLPNDAAARIHAAQVATELSRNAAEQTFGGILLVNDEAKTVLFDVPVGAAKSH